MFQTLFHAIFDLARTIIDFLFMVVAAVAYYYLIKGISGPQLQQQEEEYGTGENGKISPPPLREELLHTTLSYDLLHLIFFAIHRYYVWGSLILNPHEWLVVHHLTVLTNQVAIVIGVWIICHPRKVAKAVLDFLRAVLKHAEDDMEITEEELEKREERGREFRRVREAWINLGKAFCDRIGACEHEWDRVEESSSLLTEGEWTWEEFLDGMDAEIEECKLAMDFLFREVEVLERQVEQGEGGG